MERHLLSYNREAFREASESPCGKGIIFDALTFTSLSEAALDVLNGVDEFLASFCVPKGVKSKEEIATIITTEDVIKGIKSWSEGTTTSPSRRHLCHYKAILQDPELLQCLTWFLQLVTHRGIAISRWYNATNVFIEKEMGRPNINRLRIIHLFEADFNFFLKLQCGHRLLRRADDLGLLNDGQYGSRPGKWLLNQ
jgi:hypothetical protein